MAQEGLRALRDFVVCPTTRKERYLLHLSAQGSYNGPTRSRVMLTVPSNIDGESMHFEEVRLMEWTKPEFTVVAVTMEVTAYAATK